MAEIYERRASKFPANDPLRGVPGWKVWGGEEASESEPVLLEARL